MKNEKVLDKQKTIW